MKVACLAESRVEELIAPAYDEFGRDTITVLAKPAEIQVIATATGSAAERESRLATMQERLVELIGDAVFTRQEGDTLESVLGALLIDKGETVATAESCTGGLISERLTRVPGSSAYFLGGAVTYADESKAAILSVSEEILEAHGAVSKEVACAMAQGAIRRFASDWAVSVTGIAGPDGGSHEKPVGTVHLAVAHGSEIVRHEERLFPVGRDRVRLIAGQLALDLLRRELLVS